MILAAINFNEKLKEEDFFRHNLKRRRLDRVCALAAGDRQYGGDSAGRRRRVARLPSGDLCARVGASARIRAYGDKTRVNLSFFACKYALLNMRRVIVFEFAINPVSFFRDLSFFVDAIKKWQRLYKSFLRVKNLESFHFDPRGSLDFCGSSKILLFCTS